MPEDLNLMNRLSPSKKLKSSTAEIYYPVFLNLTGKKTVVVGGGKVAERKILGLLKVCSDIKVISPSLTKRLQKEKLKGRIRHIPRQYRKGDLKTSFLVIAATDCPSINKQVSIDAPCLVNVVDTPLLCNFIVPSVMSRGLLKIAISTSGVSPALSRLIRKELEELYNTKFRSYLNFIRRIRKMAKKMIHDKKKRGKFLKAVAAEKVVRTLRVKGDKEARKVVKDLFKKAQAGKSTVF